MFEYPIPPQGTPLSDVETEKLCLEIYEEIRTGKFKPAGKSGRKHWEQTWAKHPPQEAPPYISRPAEVLRINGKFIRPDYPKMEDVWYRQFRESLIRRYFPQLQTLYEFGCGNGWNLLAAHHVYPAMKLVGLDWAKSAVKQLPSWIEGRHFDFFSPDHKLKLEPNSGVLTVGALEQTGTGWFPFLEYLLTNKPAICVHVEPQLELYDPMNPVDLTAIHYHLARNYWQGFAARLGVLEAKGRVEILEQQRSNFGSKYIEGYSLLVWRPL